jgi:hypothetical protein
LLGLQIVAACLTANPAEVVIRKPRVAQYVYHVRRGITGCASGPKRPDDFSGGHVTKTLVAGLSALGQAQ